MSAPVVCSMDRICYTYIVINKVNGRVYYGARYAKGCHPDDLWQTYFTSSKLVKAAIKIYGKDSFTFQIRKTFGEDYQKCLRWESKVLRRLRVNLKDIFYNIEITGVPKLKYGEENQSYGKPRPDASLRMIENNPMKNPETARRVAAKNTGKPAYNKGKANPTQKIKFIENNPMKNPESLAKMLKTMSEKYGGGNACKGTVWFANIFTKQRKRVKPYQVSMYTKENGWIILSNRLPIPDSF